MHEIGMVDDIVSVIKSKLKDNSRVKKVNILIGELEHIAPDHFEFHFRERTKGTFLEDAELSFKRVEAKFRCKDCGCVFAAGKGLEGCPDCKGNLSEVVEGIGIRVDSVELT